MNPHVHIRSLPQDGTKNCCVAQQRGRRDHACLGVTLREAA